MFEPRLNLVLVTSTIVALLAPRSGLAASLGVVSTSPARLQAVAKNSAVTINFDRPVLPASITPASFRVFGKQSGVAIGPVTFSNGNASVTLTPRRPFVAGAGSTCNDHNACTAGETCNGAGLCRGFTSCRTSSTCNICGSKCTLQAGLCKCG